MVKMRTLKIHKSAILILTIWSSITSCKQSTEKKLDDQELKKIANTYGQYAPEDAFQENPEFAYYGSENEWSRRQFSEASADRLYKRRGQRQLLKILDGDLDQALELTEIRLGEDNTDAESYFIQTIVYSQLGDNEKAVFAMNKAIENGMDFGRFMAGPKELLEPLYQTESFKSLFDNYGTSLVHGPMLGRVSDSGASFWVRTWGEDRVEIRCKEINTPNASTILSKTLTSEKDDFTAIIEVNGLKSDTFYEYKVFVNGKEAPPLGEQKFRTYPMIGGPGQFSIGFGGGAGYTPPFEKTWETIKSHNLDALLLLGDNVYIDIPERPGPFHDYTYYRRQSQPYFRKMVTSTPIYAIWDDHDAATDDVWLGPYRDKPDWKEPLFNVFRVNWVNPGYGTQQWPGCWFSFSVADVDFFMLDGRMYRTNPFQPQKTMLGPVQKEWLLNALGRSTATFKVIVSPVPWAFDAKPGSNDTWNGFSEERDEIFDFLAEQNIEGVLLLSADRHRTDLWKIERGEGYPLYEFMSSRLTNIHTHELMPGALFGYNEKCSFGKLTFNTNLEDPQVNFEIVSIDNEVVYSLIIQRSELK